MATEAEETVEEEAQVMAVEVRAQAVVAKEAAEMAAGRAARR